METLAWVKSSTRKKQVLWELYQNPQFASEIAEKYDVSTKTVMSWFHTLKNGRKYSNDKEHKKLIECLTPNRQNYRLYGLTEEGKHIVEYLQERKEFKNIR